MLEIAKVFLVMLNPNTVTNIVQILAGGHYLCKDWSSWWQFPGAL